MFLAVVIVALEDDGCNGDYFSRQIALFYIPVFPFFFSLLLLSVLSILLGRLVICVERTKRGTEGTERHGRRKDKKK